MRLVEGYVSTGLHVRLQEENRDRGLSSLNIRGRFKPILNTRFPSVVICLCSRTLTLHRCFRNPHFTEETTH